MNLGQSLKYFRKRQGLNQKEVSSIAKVGIPHLSLIEKNRRDPSLQLLRKLAGIYNIPLPIIFFSSLEEEDLPYTKYHYKLIKSLIEVLITECFEVKKTDIEVNPYDDLAINLKSK